MLPPTYLDNLPDVLVELYSRYEESVIASIAKHITKMNFASAAWQVQRLNESAMLYDEIVERIAKLTGKSEAELKSIFKAAGVKSHDYDNKILKAAGYNRVLLNESPAMLDLLEAGLKKTNGALQNLVSTTTLSGQEAFIDACDLAYMQVSTGAFDYTTAIKNAVTKVAEQGLQTIAYAQKRDQLDVAVRRAVLTGVSQTAGQITLEHMSEMGGDLVRTSAHIGARPTHEVWQGKVFSLSGTNPKYPSFYENTGYGTGEGLCGWNCRHSFYPFFEGLDENVYSQETLDEYASKTVTYNGEEIPYYEATQKLRYIERNIRKSKREAIALKEAGIDNTDAIQKVKAWQAKARDFTKQTGLYREYDREWVAGKIVAVPAPKVPIPKAPTTKVSAPEVPAPNAPNITKVSERKFLGKYEIEPELIKYHIEDLIKYGKNITSEGEVNETLSRYLDKTKKRIDDSKVVIRTDRDGAIGAMVGGRYVTQFEVECSHGTYDREMRAGAENNGFNYPYNLNPKERPVYGYFSDNDPQKEIAGRVRQYGDVRFVLKDNVRDRVTVSHGDSLGSMIDNYLYPAPCKDIDLGMISRWRVQDLIKNKAFEPVTYFEAQIHSGVTMKDVELIDFMPDERMKGVRGDLAKAYNDWAEIKRIADSYGIPCDLKPLSYYEELLNAL